MNNLRYFRPIDSATKLTFLDHGNVGYQQDEMWGGKYGIDKSPKKDYIPSKVEIVNLAEVRANRRKDDGSQKNRSVRQTP